MLPKILLEQFIALAIIVLLALSVLFYAEGYRLNLKNFKITRIGIVAISTYPNGAEVYLDGKLAKKKTPFSANLTSGYYTAEVRKEGYQTWQATFKIEPEVALRYDSVVLFRKDITPRDLTDQGKINDLANPIDILASRDNGLSASDYEIWVNNKLITRFSSPISGAIWYSDKNHILFQQGKEIRVVEKNGQNNTLLVKLSDDKPIKFITNGKGDELYYFDNYKEKVAEIR